MEIPPDLRAASLRRIARALLYDDALAMDATQDAWLAAVGEPPRSGAWFGGVVRRIALSMRRDANRRREREIRAARPEELPSTVDALAQVELLRRLLDAVERLDEPYRTAIALRYFDDLPPRVIAERLGVPVNTVKTRLQRGLQTLRRDLLESDRDQLSGIAVIAGGAGFGTLAGDLGGILLGKKVVATAAALALLLALAAVARPFGWFGLRTEPSSSPTALTPATGEIGDSQVAEGSPTRDASDHRAPVAAAPTGWSLSGHVLLDQRDLPGAKLVGRWLDAPTAEAKAVREWTITTDEHGDFTWPLDTPPGPFRLELVPQIPGATAWRWSDDFLPTDPPSTDCVVHAFSNDCTLRGVVRDREHNAIQGARVTSTALVANTVTDGAGTFALPIPSRSSGAWFVVDADGFGIHVSVLGQLVPGDQALPDVVLSRELVIRGRAIDDSDVPVAGARVFAEHPYDGGESCLTLEDGSFALGGIDPGIAAIRLLASNADHAFTALRIEQREFESPSLVIRMPRGARISGRVLSPSGEPAQGVLVWADEELYAGVLPERSSWTDATGRFTLPGVEPGARSLWLRRRGRAVSRERIYVPDHASIDGLELRLAEDRELAGRVVRRDGSPVPWAGISADELAEIGRATTLSSMTFSDRDGRFRLRQLPSTTLELSAWKPGFAGAHRTRDPKEVGELVLTLDKAASLAARVVDAATGAPIQRVRARVRVSPGDDSSEFSREFAGMWNRFTEYEAVDGVWRLDGEFEADKKACVELEADGYAPARVDPLLTAIDPDPVATTIAFAKSTLLRGSLALEVDGAPVVGAEVRAFWHAGDLRSNWTDATRVATTDANGRFEFVDLPPGPVSLAISPAGVVLATDGPFDVLANATTTRRVRLASLAVASIRGRLLDANGIGLSGERVVASTLGGLNAGRSWDAQTAADGSYAVSGLPLGDYQVWWARREASAETRDLLELVHVDANRSFEHDLRPTGAAWISGRIECECEVPDRTVVQVLGLSEQPSEHARRMRAAFVKGSAFEVRGVPPGRYAALMYFDLPDGKEAKGSTGFFEVADGDTRVDVVIQLRVR
ncbi:MAG: sigma-70 family RNA polymerase sigma factor [Planctomycetota bacterium]|nr:MAG: sigma-70 family RNA polymerase sigma factor [Planctomycetota bacterium]